MKVKIELPGREPFLREYEDSVCIRDIADELQTGQPYRFVCARFDRHLRRLNDVITRSGTLELLDMRDSDGKMCYQASLTLLFCKAVRDVAGKDVTVRVNNSLSKGLYITLKGVAIDEALVEKISGRMREITELKIPIEHRLVDHEGFVDELKVLKREDLLEWFEMTPDLENIHLYTIQDCMWAFSDAVVPDTGYIDLFELSVYKFGVLLRFPHTLNPSVVPPFQEQKIIYDAFSEERQWSKVTGIRVASDLNRVILNNE